MIRIIFSLLLISSYMAAMEQQPQPMQQKKEKPFILLSSLCKIMSYRQIKKKYGMASCHHINTVSINQSAQNAINIIEGLPEDLQKEIVASVKASILEPYTSGQEPLYQRLPGNFPTTSGTLSIYPDPEHNKLYIGDINSNILVYDIGSQTLINSFNLTKIIMPIYPEYMTPDNKGKLIIGDPYYPIAVDRETSAPIYTNADGRCFFTDNACTVIRKEIRWADSLQQDSLKVGDIETWNDTTTQELMYRVDLHDEENGAVMPTFFDNSQVHKMRTMVEDQRTNTSRLYFGDNYHRVFAMEPTIKYPEVKKSDDLLALTILSHGTSANNEVCKNNSSRCIIS